MKKSAAFILLLSVLACAVFICGGKPASAATSNSNLINDLVYDNANTMSASKIDTWLNTNFPSSCISTNNGFTAADPTGYSPNPSQFFYSSTPVSAGQIIYDAAQAYGINPQVLLATLEKEENLVTGGSGCPTWRYTSAVGYGCTDSGTNTHDYSYPSGGLVTPLYYTHGTAVNSITGSCVNSGPKAGFSEQIIHAAWLLVFGQHKSEGDTGWAVVKGNWNNCDDNNTCPSAWGISASDACYGGPMTQGYLKRCPTDSSTVYYDGYTTIDGQSIHMDNGATAALYWYTPHIQSFTTVFQNWFGSPYFSNSSISMTNISQPNLYPSLGETVSYTASFTNNLSSSVTLDAVGIVGRLGSLTGSNHDFGWQGPITFAAGETKQFTFTTTIKDLDPLYVWPAVNYQGTYIQYNNWGATLTSHSPNFSLSQPLAASASPIYASQDVTFSAKLKNNESHAINYDAIGIPVRFYDHYNYDATWVGPGVLAPGAEITLSGTRNIDKPGPFTYWVSDFIGSSYSSVGSTKSFTSTQATPTFSPAALSFTNKTPVIGESLGVNFTLTNTLPVGMDIDGVGVVGRYGSLNGQNRDIGWQGPIHFNAGETKTFTGLRTITEIGSHYYWIAVLSNGSYTQYNAWGSTIVSRAPSFSVNALSFTNNSPAVGENLGVTFTITNNLPGSIDVDAVGVVGRYASLNGQNRDIGWQGPIHFNAGETKTFTGSRIISDAGTHYYWIGILYRGSYLQYNNWGSTIISH